MKEIRKKIDKIDSKINELLDERAHLVKEIAIEKKIKNEPIYDPLREKKIIEKISKKKGFPLKSKINIFKEIFAGSSEIQKKIINK